MSVTQHIARDNIRAPITKHYQVAVRSALLFAQQAQGDTQLGSAVFKVLNVVEVLGESKVPEDRLLQSQTHAVHVAVDL